MALYTAFGVYHQYTYVAVFDSSYCPYDGVILHIFVHFGFFAYACRIYQIEVVPELIVASIYRVSRGACYFGNDIAVVVEESIYKRRFARIGSSYDGKLRQVVEVLRLFFVFGESVEHLVEQVAAPQPVDRRQYKRVAQPERIELRCLILQVERIHFVCHDYHVFTTFPQYLSHKHIEVCHSAEYIDHKQYDVCLFDGYTHLSVYLLFEDVFRPHDPAARIYHRKLFAVPFHFTVMTVASSACLVVYYCPAALRQSVEQSGFAHIRTSYYCYYIAHYSKFFTKIVQKLAISHQNSVKLCSETHFCIVI